MAEKKTAAKTTAKKPAAVKKAAAPKAAVKKAPVKKAAPKAAAKKPVAKAAPAKKVVAPKTAGKSNLPKTLKLTQTGSKSGATGRQVKNLVGLGLGRIGKIKMLEDTPAIRGMIEKVKHLITVENTK